MKSLKIIFSIFLAATFLTSCQDQLLELNQLPDQSEIKYSVIQDYTIDPGGNTVILKNETPGTVSMWDYGTGRSNRQVDTIRFAFQGEYTIKFSALTGGGVVKMPDINIEVTQDNLNYVSDPLWEALTGGVGNSKVWLLDLDEDGVSKYFNGPIYFAGHEYGWGNQCIVEGGNCWIWEAGWKGNEWIGDKGDYGTMTFSLMGGPFVTVDHKKTTNRGIENGTFFLNVNNRTLTLTDVAPLQNSWANNDVVGWSNGRLITLTKDYMQIAYRHKSKDEVLIFNYISKDYSDNWVPADPGEPAKDEGFEPEFAPGELLKMLTGGPSSGRIWKLDANGNPVDWVANGIGWTSSHSSSRDWGWNNSWDEVAANSWIKFDTFLGAQTYTRNQNGTITSGTFSINEETNEITLEGNTLIQNSASWMNPTTNTIKVVKAFPNDFKTKGIWFGTGYDAGKNEWLVFHYIIPN